MAREILRPIANYEQLVPTGLMLLAVATAPSKPETAEVSTKRM